MNAELNSLEFDTDSCLIVKSAKTMFFRPYFLTGFKKQEVAEFDYTFIYLFILMYVRP